MTEDERPQSCSFAVYPEFGYPAPQPAEYCEEEVVDGEDYCPAHLARLEGEDPDAARDRMWDEQWL